MCIISLAWHAHPHWKLVAIGNRDELHGRPAEPLTRWKNPDHMLAGRDVKAGGTWLGISEQGRFAVVTNLSGCGAPDANRASRGDLLKEFLSGHGRCSDLDAVSFSDFNPFNLITIANNQAVAHSNRPDRISRVLEPGIHGLSNGPLDRPWPKSKHLDAALGKWLQSWPEDPSVLLDILSTKTTYPLSNETNTELQNKREAQNSAIFISNPVYGTRCSTIVAIDHQGKGSIFERRYAPSGQSTGETCVSFSWPD